MKTIIKTTLLSVFMLTVLSCKKEVPATENSSMETTDSTQMSVDTIGPNSDTTNVNGAGTTGATGEGSTGSGSAGTQQKGNTNVTTDSVSTKKGS